ncbi:MAG: polyprenyl synthetase family protein [Lactovum sp.]
MQVNFLEETLKEFYKNNKIPKNLSEGILYSLLLAGKRIRPLLFLEIIRAFGHDLTHSHYKVAAAVEMIHTGSLIHDDLPAMDDDDYRRGSLSNHKKFNEASAILAGDALFFDPYYLLTQTDFSDSQKLSLILELSKASGSLGMVAGQVIDMDSEKKKIDLITLKKLHALKTGALLTFPFVAAAILLEKNVEDFREVGEQLGLAFQVRDDILDITADFSELGKTPGKDDKAEKSTYVSLLGLECSKEILAESLSEIKRKILSWEDFKSEEILKIIEGLSL